MTTKAQNFMFLLLFILFLAPLARAQSANCARSLDTFIKSTEDKSVYTRGTCGFNVARLLEKLSSDGVNTTGTKVLLILGERRRFAGVPKISDLTPSNLKTGNTAFYHAVLLHEGLIFDLDLNSGQVLPPEQYFTKVFPDRAETPYQPELTDRLNNIVMRAIPAHEYLQKPTSVGFREWEPIIKNFRRLDLQDYPTTTIQKFLETQR